MRKSTLAIVGLTAVLLLGAIRQGRDANAVRRGERAAVYADTMTPLAVPALFEVPARPTRRVKRITVALWSAPLSVVGATLALLGGSKPSYDQMRGCWVARNVGGVSAWLQQRVNADAHTLGQVVLCRAYEPSTALLDHESAHVRQAERFGVTMPVVYGLLTALNGYADNPLEVSARNFAASRKPPAS